MREVSIFFTKIPLWNKVEPGMVIWPQFITVYIMATEKLSLIICWNTYVYQLNYLL